MVLDSCAARGWMAEKTIEESKATRKAAQGGGKSKTGGAQTLKSGIAAKGLNGQAYMVDLSHLQKIQLYSTTPNPNEFAGVASFTPTNPN
ncbi:hypothetical protein H2248_010398 [Termitomyces sp. 'cryptogamus']|nr:hypothetical protein H2248_010398 [Termitomyces sp. 'cryptogamus']